MSNALGVTPAGNLLLLSAEARSPDYALFIRFFDLLDAAAEEAVASSGPGRERFDAMLTAHIRIVASDPTLSSVFGEGRGNLPPEAADVIQARRRAKRPHRRRLSRRSQEGELNSDMPATIAVDLLVGAANWIHRWYRLGGPISPDQLGVRAQEFLRNGYGNV